jgi:hypothetical protein
MPVISIFFGIVVRMYHNDHAPPHFHASYQGFEALIRIHDQSVMAGSLPGKALRIVQDWAATHSQELLANWQRGIDLLPMEMIGGADLDD